MDGEWKKRSLIDLDHNLTGSNDGSESWGLTQQASFCDILVLIEGHKSEALSLIIYSVYTTLTKLQTCSVLFIQVFET